MIGCLREASQHVNYARVTTRKLRKSKLRKSFNYARVNYARVSTTQEFQTMQEFQVVNKLFLAA